MTRAFKPRGLAALVGSLPLADHAEAVALVGRFTPEIPSWPQLPVYKEEGMIAQFLPGLPGVAEKDSRVFLDDEGKGFDAKMVAFYEDYLAVTEGTADLEKSRFSLSLETAGGFFAFLEALQRRKTPPTAVKGQVTGPITFATALVNTKGTPIFYDLQLRDAAVKHLTLKARWQVRRLKAYDVPVILFVDEPGMAGFGSSEFTSISKEEVHQCLGEVIEGIHAEGGMAGVHVCANTDWSLILSLPFDIVNFDAYAYFDRFVLYPRDLKRFLESGGILAWGMVPTLSEQALLKETVDSLKGRWDAGVRQIVAMGVDQDTIAAQSMITPSCGMGSLSLDLAKRVLIMTRDLALRIRQSDA